MIHESPIVEFLAESIKSTILSDANFQRLRASVRKKLKQKGQAPSINLKPLRQRLTKLDGDLKNAMAELARTPADLYDLAVADVREIKAKRDAAANALATVEARQDATSSDVDRLAERALLGLHELRDRLTDVDDRVARNALQAIVAGIDLEFEHVQHRKIVRSHFKQGIVRFRAPALLNDPTSRRA